MDFSRAVSAYSRSMRFALCPSACLLACLAVLEVSTEARAEPDAGAGKEEAVTILLLVEPGQDALEARLRAELVALGFAVSRKVAPLVAGPPNLEKDAKEAGAVAAIRVRSSSAGVEVWIADRVTGKTVLREVVREKGGGDEGVVAVRVVELLRASLLEVESKLPVRGDVAAPPLVKKVADEVRPPRRSALPPDLMRLFLGGALSVSPGALSPLGHVRLGASLRPIGRLGLDLDVLTPTAPASISALEGRAVVSQLAVTAGLHASVLPDSSWFRLRLGAGAGLLWARVSAQAVGPFVARDADFFAGFVYARVSGVFPLVPQVRIRADVDLAVALPELRVLFSGRLVGSWGLPVALPTLGIEVAFGG